MKERPWFGATCGAQHPTEDLACGMPQGHTPAARHKAIDTTGGRVVWIETAPARATRAVKRRGPPPREEIDDLKAKLEEVTRALARLSGG